MEENPLSEVSVDLRIRYVAATPVRYKAQRWENLHEGGGAEATLVLRCIQMIQLLYPVGWVELSETRRLRSF